MTSMIARRRWLKSAVGSGAALASGLAGAAPPGPADLPAPLQGAPSRNASDERYWLEVASLYKVSPQLVNLDNGFYGVLSRPVLEAYHRHVDRLNEENSIFLRQQYAKDEDAIRERIAAVLEVGADEIALTRGATEALQNLIFNYKGLKPGDGVLYADLDYDSTQANFDYLQAVRGVRVGRLVLPEPASHQGILDAYAKAFSEHPRTRLLLLTHVSHKTGLVLPVAEIIRMARRRDIDVIVDAAHSWGQVDFRPADLDADFIAFNLHKWMGAPLGVGFLYIRRSRLPDISPHLALADANGKDDIRSRVHTGTTNTANVLTIPDALDFQQRIGVPNKEARLRYLRDLWVHRLEEHQGLQVLTPEDPRLHAGITSFRLRGRTSKEDNQRLVRQLRDQHGIFTVARGGVAAGDCVRVTPAIYTRPSEIERLVSALQAIAAS